MEKKEASGVVSYFPKNTRDRGTLSEQYLPAIRHHPTVCHSLRNFGINDKH